MKRVAARWWDPTGELKLPRGWFRYTMGSTEAEGFLRVDGSALRREELFAHEAPLSLGADNDEGEPPDLLAADAYGAPLTERLRALAGGRPSLGVVDHELLLELTDAAQIVGLEGARALHELAATDRAGAYDLVLEHFWGRSLEERRFRLARKPEVELLARLLPLVGCVRAEHLRYALHLVFGGRARAVVDVEGPTRPLDLASPLRFSCAPEEIGVPDACPPVVGPAPLAQPRLHLVLPFDADERAVAAGYESLDQAHRPAYGLATHLAALYAAPHVEVRVTVRAREADDEPRRSKDTRRATAPAARASSSAADRAAAGGEPLTGEKAPASERPKDDKTEMSARVS